MHRLIAEDLAKKFGRRLLFRSLSRVIEGGEVLAVTGSNGSGKSTLLRILAGVMTPSKGRVTLELEGRFVSTEGRPLNTGFVAPYLNVYDGFSATENLEFIAKARRLANASERIDEVLSFVGLEKRKQDRVKTFSSGMKQRVKFAAALLADPPMLLLDEPSTNLDEAGVKMVRSVISNQKEKGGIVILATNNAEEQAWCDASICVEDFRG